MAVSDEQFKALSDEVKTLSDALKPDTLATAIGNAVAAAVKPLTEAHETMLANQKAKDDAEQADLVATVVKGNILDEETAKATPLNTLRKLAEKAKPGAAAPLNAAFNQANGAKPAFKLPKAEG